MALPSSGALSFNDINTELGNTSGTVASMDTMTLTAVGSTTITNQPDQVSDWYSYNHFGRMYSENQDFIVNGHIKRQSQGSYYLMNGTEAFEFNADRNEATACYKSNTGTAIVSGDNIEATIYRRTKNTTNTWSTAQFWSSYTSQTYSCNFNGYDYFWLIASNK